MVSGGFSPVYKLMIIVRCGCSRQIQMILKQDLAKSGARTTRLTALAFSARLAFAGALSTRSGVMSADLARDPNHGVMKVVRRMLANRSINLDVSPQEDLTNVGLTSLDMVELVLSVESELDMSIPEAFITPANFRSIASIDALVTSLRS